MQKIKLLPESEIHKIAAGQVVDRPANVVKELIENAIDAGATAISLYIQDGGKKLIRVADNGYGMSPLDAKTSIQKHATSKIEKMDDLGSIDTFGFRGEALASISAVSKVTILTKEANTEQGIKLEVQESKIVTESFIPLTTGTDIITKDLFYNVPARQKFLKKRETENRHITQLFHSFCLDYLSIHFKLHIDSKITLNCPPTKDIISRTAQLWGHTFSEHMIPIAIEKSDKHIKLYGAISDHQYFRYDRNNIFFFVNKRWIRNHQLSSALLKGYLNAMPPGKYPVASIFIEIDPTQVDINTHPRKEEVKFLHPRIIATLVQTTVKKALEENLAAQLKKRVVLSSQEQTYQKSTTNFQASPKPFQPFNFDKFLKKDSNPSSVSSAPIYVPNENKNTPANQSIDIEEPKKIIESQEKIIPEYTQHKIEQKTYDIIGQFKKTYILIEKDNGLFLIDQHAAHERILYQIFSKCFEDVATVKLLFPQIIILKEEDISILEKHLNIFKHNGIEIEIFGQNQIIIQSTPVHIKNINMEELVKEMLSWIYEYQDLDQELFFKKINEKIHTQMACKAAIKAGDTLTIEQMKKLLADLEKTENRFTCPHGRPTGWILTIHDIEKKFKRKR